MLGLPTAQNGKEEMWRGLWKWAGCACHHGVGVAAASASWALGMNRCGTATVMEKGKHPCSHQSRKPGSSFHGIHQREAATKSAVPMTCYGHQGGGDGGCAALGKPQ